MEVAKQFTINNLTVQCRPCTLEDRDFVLELFRKTIFPFVAKYHNPSIEMFDKRFYNDYTEKKILLIDSQPIGVFQLSERNNRLAVTGLFLLEEFQGLGIAKHLMEYVETVALREGYTETELLVWDNNPAVKFYEKLNYSIETSVNHKYLMVKHIAK